MKKTSHCWSKKTKCNCFIKMKTSVSLCNFLKPKLSVMSYMLNWIKVPNTSFNWTFNYNLKCRNSKIWLLGFHKHWLVYNRLWLNNKKMLMLSDNKNSKHSKNKPSLCKEKSHQPVKVPRKHKTTSSMSGPCFKKRYSYWGSSYSSLTKAIRKSWTLEAKNTKCYRKRDRYWSKYAHN